MLDNKQDSIINSEERIFVPIPLMYINNNTELYLYLFEEMKKFAAANVMSKKEIEEFLFHS
jgi:hypothetical protein